MLTAIILQTPGILVASAVFEKRTYDAAMTRFKSKKTVFFICGDNRVEFACPPHGPQVLGEFCLMRYLPLFHE